MRRITEGFGARLKQLREAANLSADALAEKAGLSRAAVYHYEAGTREPSWEAVRRLAAALGMSVAAFE